MSLKPGDILDEHYQILELLGVGGYGVVYKAKDLRLGREVAVKLMRQSVAINDTLKARSQREAQMLSSLRHKNIVSCYAVGYLQSSMYCVMEFISGTNLLRKIELGPKGRLNWSEASQLVMQVANGMHHAHSMGITHRDLTTGNILVTTENNENLAKVVDFGLGGTFGEMSRWQKLTQPGDVMGTPLYMSPEQCSAGEVDQRTDIYSLGCILFHCLTGKPPFVSSEDFQVMYRQIHEEPAPLAIDDASEVVPEGMQKILSLCLAKEPKDRYSSMMELHDDLSDLLRAPEYSEPSSPRLSTASACTSAVKSPSRWPVSVLAAVGVLGIIVAVSLLQPALALRLASPVLPPAAFEAASASAIAWLCRLNRNTEALQLVHETLTKFKSKLSAERIARLYLLEQQLEYADGDYAAAQIACLNALNCLVDKPSLLAGKNADELIVSLCRAVENSGVSEVGDESAGKLSQLIGAAPDPRLIEALLCQTTQEYRWTPQAFGKNLDRLLLIELLTGYNVDGAPLQYVEKMTLRCKLSPLQRSILLLRFAVRSNPQDAVALARAAWAECKKHPDELPEESMVAALILAGYANDFQKTTIQSFANCDGTKKIEDSKSALETLRWANGIARRHSLTSRESALIAVRLAELYSEAGRSGEAQSAGRDELSRTNDPRIASALISACALDLVKSQSTAAAVAFISAQKLTTESNRDLREALMDFGKSRWGTPLLRAQALQVLTMLPARTPDELLVRINAKLLLAGIAERNRDFKESVRLCQDCFDELAKPSALSDAVRIERRICAGFSLAGCEYAMSHAQRSLQWYDELDRIRRQSPAGKGSTEGYAAPIAIRRATLYSALGKNELAASMLQGIINENFRADVLGDAYCELARLEIRRNNIPEAKKALEEGFRVTATTFKTDPILDESGKAVAAGLHETIASEMRALALRSGSVSPSTAPP